MSERRSVWNFWKGLGVYVGKAMLAASPVIIASAILVNTVLRNEARITNLEAQVMENTVAISDVDSALCDMVDHGRIFW